MSARSAEDEALYTAYSMHSTEMRDTEFDSLIPSTTESSSSSAAVQAPEEEDTSDSEDEEAMARNTSASSSSSSSSSVMVASTVFGPNVDDLWNRRKEGDRRYGQRQKRKEGRTAGMLLPPEVAEPLAEANYHYLAGNYPGLSLTRRCVCQCP